MILQVGGGFKYVSFSTLPGEMILFFMGWSSKYLPSTLQNRQVSLLRSKAVIRCSKEAPAAESFAEEVEDCGFEAKVISDSWQPKMVFLKLLIRLMVQKSGKLTSWGW